MAPRTRGEPAFAANRIMGNAMSGGMTKIGFGLIALLVGGVVAAAGKRIQPPQMQAPALAKVRRRADPIGALKNIGWHTAMVAQADAEECVWD